MTYTSRPKTGRTTYHRDGTVTTWCVFTQTWRRGSSPSDRMLASMDNAERARVMRHTAAQ